MRGDYKKRLSRQIEKHFSDLEIRIMEDIVRRIRKTGKITSTADWQINRLRILGYSSEDIEQMLKETLNKSYPEMFELYDKVIDWEYVRNKEVYEQVNAEFIPYEENEELQQITEALIRQSSEDLKNITNSLGFYLDYGTGKPVTQLTNSGLRQIDYASGRANRIDVAARRAVMTGVSQLSGKISEMNAEKLGTEHFEVEWHAGARPTHAVWQGRVYSKEELTTVCGLGTVTGLLGANCYHMYYPFVPGISVRNWTDEWLEEQNRKENTPKSFNGKEYTLYEAKQRQRQMETCMRAQREKVELLKKGDADPDDVMIARAKYQGQLNEYSRFCKKMGLTEERERIYYDMRGRVATNSKKQNARYTADMIRNADRDSKQYYRYRNILGDDVGSLADFRQMKYNEPKEFNLLTDYKNSVANGMISPLSGFKNYKKLHDRIEKELVGMKTSNGIKISGQSKHFIERVIGTKEDPKTERPRSGVDIEDIWYALLYGGVRTRKRDPDSVKFVTDRCIVSVNPNTGILIQCNPQ